MKLSCLKLMKKSINIKSNLIIVRKLNRNLWIGIGFWKLKSKLKFLMSRLKGKGRIKFFRKRNLKSGNYSINLIFPKIKLDSFLKINK